MRTSVDVHNHLVERDIAHELFNVRGRFRSSERLASVLDLPPEQVGKVVVFETDRGPLAALVSSQSDPDPKRLARAAKVEQLRKATQARSSQLSEYLAEATPPVGLPEQFTVVMDRALTSEPVLYFPGGEATAVLKVRGKDLVRASGAKVARIASERIASERKG
ncbi:MAG: YbaK/EbsC family protein [Actinomycetota bacterium]|nr:YbaK/EbsC family protein [Actinomycetota bacterium]